VSNTSLIHSTPQRITINVQEKIMSKEIYYYNLPVTSFKDIEIDENILYEAKIILKYSEGKTKYTILKVNNKVYRIKDSKLNMEIWKSINEGEHFKLELEKKILTRLGKEVVSGRLYPHKIDKIENENEINIQNTNEKKIEIGEIEDGKVIYFTEINIKPCTFCGQSKSLDFATKEMIFEGKENISNKEDVAIICNKLKGGCGSLYPFMKNKEEVLSVWQNKST
jgi:hypothetical protein